MSSHGDISKLLRLFEADEIVFLTNAWNKKYMNITQFILLRSTFTSLLKNLVFGMDAEKQKSLTKGIGQNLGFPYFCITSSAQ